MECVVQKFGGTSVATLDRIKQVANIIAKSKAKGKKIVAVVSAMAGTTNRFIDYVHNLGACEGEPEYDCVVSSGELITAGLLAIALKKIGIKSKSYASWQVPIVTDDSFGRALIKKVDSSNLLKDMSNDIVPVVCGFQGITSDNRVTTLGRGGSDFTAVAVASSLSAVCEIYSDVDGVYTIDPNLCSKAKRLNDINYDEMLEMSAEGAKVLQEQSVQYAKDKNVVVRVVSSFVENPGTIISSSSKSKAICGIAVTNTIAHLRIAYNSNEDCSNDFVNVLEQNFIHVDVLKNKTGLVTISLDKKKLISAKAILKEDNRITLLRQEVVRQPVSKISIIGNSICEGEIINALKEEKITVIGYQKRNIKLDILVSAMQLQKAISYLHTICGLDQ